METLQRVGFRLRDDTGATVVLDLRIAPEKLFKQLHTNRRSNVRRAMTCGVEVFQASGDEDLAAYYAVYQRWRHTRRKKIYGELLPFPAFAEEQRRSDNL